MINYLIIDDEHIAHDIIKGYCDLLPGLRLAKHCYDAIEALEYLRTYEVDLIFLDLNMPKLKGFEFLRTLPNPPKVIVTTAYKEYALEGYELNIIDYLLKPFSFERFLKAVNKAMNSDSIKATSPKQNKETSAKSIFLRINKNYIQLTVDDILYIEAAGNYAKIITINDNILIREKISELLTLLSHRDLIQVHKSFVVSRKYINRIEGNQIFVNEHVIPIGKTYRAAFIQSLGTNKK
jgi:DNA-binding LytR/AlgR family response regulator